MVKDGPLRGTEHGQGVLGDTSTWSEGHGSDRMGEETAELLLAVMKWGNTEHVGIPSTARSDFLSLGSLCSKNPSCPALPLGFDVQ